MEIAHLLDGAQTTTEGQVSGISNDSDWFGTPLSRRLLDTLEIGRKKTEKKIAEKSINGMTGNMISSGNSSNLPCYRALFPKVHSLEHELCDCY